MHQKQPLIHDKHCEAQLTCTKIEMGRCPVGNFPGGELHFVEQQLSISVVYIQMPNWLARESVRRMHTIPRLQARHLPGSMAMQLSRRMGRTFL